MFNYKYLFADPLVKVYLLVKDKRVKKKKTAVRKSTCNPVWNEALTFSLSSSNLSNAAVEVIEMFRLFYVKLFTSTKPNNLLN